MGFIRKTLFPRNKNEGKHDEDEFSIRNGTLWCPIEGKGNRKGWEATKACAQKEIDTLTKLVELNAKEYRNSPCVGTRKVIKREVTIEREKKFEKLTLGDYQYKTFEQTGRCINKLATSLISIGMKKGDKIAIFAETREEWLMTSTAALRLGMVVVTMYTNLTNTAITHAIRETEIETVAVSSETLPRMKAVLSNCPTIKRIIVFEDQIDGIGEVNIQDDIKVLPYSSLLESEGTLPDHPDKNDLAIIMYTSGSTGTPKGVELTHDNIFATILSGFIKIEISSEDIYLAYLPLAHIMEMAFEYAALATGCTIIYSSPLTLTSTSPKIAKGIKGDAEISKPTVMPAVPLILDRIAKGIIQKVSKSSPMQSRMFYGAMKAKQQNENSLMSKICDSLIFNKIKQNLGGQVRIMVVGSAPLSSNTYRTIRSIFGCKVQGGFGCTETTACATVMSPSDDRPGHCGGLNPFNYIKLESWTEGGYDINDKPYPRGEVIIGGRSVAQRYYKNEKETKEAFFQENGVNWFRTGDIGQMDETGVLYIVDRKKNLVKLKTGEYVSLGGLETIIKTHKLISNVCAFAYSTEEYTIAIVVPSDSLMETLKENGVGTYHNLTEACEDKKVVNFVCKEIQFHCSRNDLNKWDIPKKIHLTNDPWTPESGMVTVSMKIRRKHIEETYKKHINDLYFK